MRLTEGKFSRIKAALPSADALLTTNTSLVTSSAAWTEERQVPIRSDVLYDTIIIDKSMIFTKDVPVTHHR
jgi:hypothetical protein